MQIEKLIAEAHNKITRIKGRDYAPSVQEIQTYIDNKLKLTK